VTTYLPSWWIDTCKDDLTAFDNCVSLERLDRYGDGSWDSWYDSCSGYSCQVFGTPYGQSGLQPGHYRLGISGQSDRLNTYTRNVDEDHGEYVLRMTCGEGYEDYVVAVTDTAAPTPAPTGLFEIPARDGRLVGDIGCGVTLEGETSARSGDFHRFTVIKGGVDWVKFDTCDETSFKNFLFVWELYNQTGHEHYQYGRDNSLGWTYNDDSTCNEITMNDLPEGTYYVNIEGYNYFFDYGQYTLHMECSDNSAVAGASDYNEYKTGLLWWVILLIVLACLCFCGCVIGLIFYCKKRGGIGGGAPSAESEMGRTTGSGE
jgi:hypothetical protein